MLAKGAESLPKQAAHDYKALAVSFDFNIETLRCQKL